MSEVTNQLFDKRSSIKGVDTKKQFDDVQTEIRKNNLNDFDLDQWVGKRDEVIVQSEGRGDTRDMYKGVKSLANNRETPSPNLTVDKDGNMIT